MAINFLNTIAVDENVLFVDTTNDRVGIGTASPGQTLDVTGNIRGNNLYVNDSSVPSLYMERGDGLPQPVIRLVKSNDNLIIGHTAIDEVIFYDDAGEAMRLDGAGNLGIGTTSPGEKLDVDGNIKIKNALLSNQENTDIDSAASEVVAQVAHATYTAAFFDFVVKKGTNVRSGTVYACHNGDSTPLVEFTETSTNDLGDTSDVTLSVDISGANMRLVATVTSDDWSVKSLIRAI